MTARSLALLSLSLSAPLAAQHWSPHYGLPGSPHAGAFDPVRQRPVVLVAGDPVGGQHLWEFGPRGWQQRNDEAAPASADGQLLITQPNGRLSAVGLARVSSRAQEYDGVRWHDTFAVGAFLGAGLAGFAFDPMGAVGLTFGGMNSILSPSQDTWLLQGGVWTQVPVQGAWPPPRFFPHLVFDGGRQRAVLVGGADASNTPIDDTWEWNGTSWQQFGGTGPGTVAQGSFAYDPATQACYLFGGYDAAFQPRSTTWRFDGAQWTQVGLGAHPDARLSGVLFPTPAGPLLVGGYGQRNHSDTWLLAGGQTWVQVAPDADPEARIGAAMAFDTVRGELLLAGGMSDNFGAIARTDFWTWRDGWRLRPTPTPMPWRVDAAMAFDRARGEAVLFGGQDQTGGQPPRDTWIWNGVDWAQRPTVNAPSARTGHRLSYDVARQRIVLFGGFDLASSSPVADTWEWDGVNWQLLTTAASPPARAFHQQAFDAAGNRTVVFLGSFAFGQQIADTWLFDGVNWTAAAPTQIPGPRVLGCAFDENRGQLVALARNREFRWTGADWLSSTIVPDPLLPFADSNAVVHDPRRQCLWLFTQADGGPVSLLFAYTPTPNAAAAYGTGCAAPGDTVPDLFAIGRPVVPNPDFALGARVGGGALPMLLAIGTTAQQAPLGGGCSLLVDNVFLVTGGASDAHGFGELTVPVPDLLLLRGMTFRAQMFTQQQNGIGASRGLMLVVGD